MVFVPSDGLTGGGGAGGATGGAGRSRPALPGQPEPRARPAAAAPSVGATSLDVAARVARPGAAGSGGTGGLAGTGGAAGRGGAGRRGGDGRRGRAGGTGGVAGTGGAAGRGGTGGAAGRGGTGGAPCTSTAEFCYNGADDDCDGRIDCEDSDCTPIAQCAPLDAGGARIGVMLAATDLPAELHRHDGPQPESLRRRLRGMSCRPPTVTSCSATISSFMTATDCGNQNNPTRPKQRSARRKRARHPTGSAATSEPSTVSRRGRSRPRSAARVCRRGPRRPDPPAG